VRSYYFPLCYNAEAAQYIVSYAERRLPVMFIVKSQSLFDNSVIFDSARVGIDFAYKYLVDYEFSKSHPDFETKSFS
jgi:hypothetical protein